MEQRSDRELKAESILCLVETVNSQSKQKEEKCTKKTHEALQGKVSKD